VVIVRRRFAVAVCLVAVLSGCGDRTEGRVGADLFEVSCAGCHLGDGSGGGLGPALDTGSNAASLSDEQIAQVIRDGPGTMPGFDQLTDTQIESLVAHLRSLQE
jgi:mono/diheme cytochrome c family protein